MGSIRNEDYRQLSAFYANPEKYIENVGRTAAGRGEYDRYEWKDNAKTLKKAIGRFYETTGGEMDEGQKGDTYFRGGLSLDGIAGASWAKGGNSFFRDFENYDHFEERYDEKRAKERAEEKPETAATPEAAEPVVYNKSETLKNAEDRLANSNANIGDVIYGKQTPTSFIDKERSGFDDSYGFDPTSQGKAQDYADSVKNITKDVQREMGVVTRGPGIGTVANGTGYTTNGDETFEYEDRRKAFGNSFTDKFKVGIANQLTPTNSDGSPRISSASGLRTKILNGNAFGGGY